MRLALILICLLAFAATAWHAVTRGSDVPLFGGVPGIEAATVGRVSGALGETTLPVEISVSGRTVFLSGSAQSAEARDALVAAAGSVPLVRGVVSRMEVLPRADPFLLIAIRSAEGLALSGNVPGSAARDALLAEARALFPAVEAELEIAGGAPEGWQPLALAAVRALAPLTKGRTRMEGDVVELSGTAPDETARAAALSAAEGAPGTWQARIDRADALNFTAMKTPDGAVIVGGSVPDTQTRDALIRAAEEISAVPVAGEVALAGGTPPPDWSLLVGRGLRALSATADGLLTVAGSELSLSGSIPGEEARAELLATVEPGWTIELTVVEPRTPPAEIVLRYDEKAGLAVAGTLPAVLSPEIVEASLPGADASRLSPAEGQEEGATGPGAAPGWEAALEALSIVLPRFASAQARLRDRRLAISGQLGRGFSADGTRATLLSALGPDWRLDLDLSETDPLAELIFTGDGETLTLSGLLPGGLAPGEAMETLGVGVVGEGLAGGGAGDAEAWSRTLSSLGGVVGLFRTVRGKVTEDQIALGGVLRPGYPADAVAARLTDDVPEGWEATLELEETPPGEGDRRVGLQTGAPEIFRRGFWLPELDFPVSPERCEAETDAALEEAHLSFVTGSATIDETGRPLIDRLGAIAVRCLNSSAMRLEIAGHTDSVGNDAENQALSEARAAAVRDALLARGVREDALSAVGHGENQPLASNDTAEGRARNRRIDFNWSGT